MNKPNRLTLNELAEEFGLTSRAIRGWASHFPLPPPAARNPQGRFIYEAAAVRAWWQAIQKRKAAEAGKAVR